ncbi:hypothetical protein [Rhizobium sp. S163]|uniref:hypothetical protein n=1 Tax=Rhizobium sp. S163 TaxID=3055039 RepID=UPI0025A9D41B|nr:hypothetical protein [Rhizobium sp. S163]MDM9648541.1 hypothetical protein [Rhizobium sp. S163]
MKRFGLTACALLIAAVPLAAHAAETTDPILPASITFATSTGYWADDGNAPAVTRPPVAATPNAPATATPAAPSQPRHGYYKLFAVRQADRTAKVYLQQIAQTETGPEIVSTVEVQELNDLNPYVTDIRPENSTGRLNEPGLFAMVYLKTDPDSDANSWTVIIDEFGDISVEKSGH